MMTKDEAIAHVEGAGCSACRLQTLTFDPETITECLFYAETGDRSNWDGTSSCIMVRLSDKRFAVVTEWSDSTGHG